MGCIPTGCEFMVVYAFLPNVHYGFRHQPCMKITILIATQYVSDLFCIIFIFIQNLPNFHAVGMNRLVEKHKPP